MNNLETAIICDALHALGFEPTILSTDFRSNLQKRVIGRARTILLKPLDEHDDPEALYRGLYLLDEIENGDIVVVANGFSNCAYFGELMSTFSKRNGAVGAIVDGCTRDKDATIDLGFPVFAKNWTGRDLRDRGTVKDIDCEVIVDGVTINRGDLICADGDGIVIIPSNIEVQVLAKANEIIETEKKVKKMLSQNKKAKEIMNDCGEF